MLKKSMSLIFHGRKEREEEEPETKDIYQGDESDTDSEYSEDGADALTVDDATGADRSCTGDDTEKNGEDFDTSSTNLVSFAQSQNGQRTEKIFYQQRLPFKVQKLPYANELEADSAQYFAEIKAGIANSILMREIRGPLLHWCHELNRYISLYTRHYTITDAVALIKTLYDVLCIPELDLRIVKVVASTITTMLKKPQTLSRTELTLEWRPLFRIYSYIRFKHHEEKGTLLMPKGIQKQIELLIANARVYFRADATKEILAEVRPLLAQYDSMFPRGLLIANLFLPTLLTVEEHEKHGAALWFDEMWAWYERQIGPCKPQSCAVVLPKLFARLAVDCPGYVNFSQPKYCQIVFQHLMRSFDLPITTYKSHPVTLSHQKNDLGFMTRFIVYMFGGENGKCVQQHLDVLMNALDTFYHPSNLSGRSSKSLLLLMQYLTWNMCLRVRRERYSKTSWIREILPEMRLTNNDIDTFVKTLLPRCLMAIFAKYDASVAASTLKYLAQLSPHITISAIMEQFDGAVESLIEPHRLQQLLNTLQHIALPLMRDGAPVDAQPVIEARKSSMSTRDRKRHVKSDKDDKVQLKSKDLRLHVIPLLNMLLPALDPNDVTKASAAFGCLTAFCTLLPFADCSEAVHMRDDMNDAERELCSQTAMLEEFVENVLERLFQLIDQYAISHQVGTMVGANSGHGASSAAAADVVSSMEEHIMRSGSSRLIYAILMNCTTKFAELVGNRVYNFVRDNEFTNKLASATIGEMIVSVLKTYPDKYFPLFFEHVHSNLNRLLTEECLQQEEVDNSTMWYMSLLPFVVVENGTFLVPYQEKIIDILTRACHFRCRVAQKSAMDALENMLRAITNVRLRPRIAMRTVLDQPLDQYLPIRHWADIHDRKEFVALWELPVPERDKPFCERLLQVTLYPTFEQLRSDDVLSDKEQLLSLLSIVKACYAGVSYWLPMLSSDMVPLVTSESAIAMRTKHNRVNSSELESACALTGPGGVDLRIHGFEELSALCERMLRACPSDTKSMSKLIACTQIMLYQQGVNTLNYTAMAKACRAIQYALSDTIRGSRGMLDYFVYEQIFLAHDYRRVMLAPYAFTMTHARCLQLLFTLSTSHYAQTRIDAQRCLDGMLSTHPYSYMQLLPRIVHILTAHRPVSDTFAPHNRIVHTEEAIEVDGFVKVSTEDAQAATDEAVITHEQFKGALYVLTMGGKFPVIVRHNWAFVRELWPALARANHGEKPSVIGLMTTLQEYIIDGSESFFMQAVIPDECMPNARALHAVQNTHAPPAFTLPTEDEVQASVKREIANNERHKRLYYELIDELYGIVVNADRELHWRQEELASVMLATLIRYDMHIPDHVAIQMFKMIVDDSLRLRKSALRVFNSYLKIEKPPTKKMIFPIPANAPRASEVSHPVRWGIRADNFPHAVYRDDALPHTEAATYDETIWLDKPHHTLYCWPDELRVSAPAREQSMRQRSYEQLKSVEKVVVDTIRNDIDGWMTKFEKLHTLEENKGQEKFDSFMSSFAYYILCVTYDAVLPQLQQLCDRLLQSEAETKQKMAAELLCGISKGIRHWPHAKVMPVRKWLRASFETAMTNMNGETIANWATASAIISGDIDPRRLDWLYELLFDVCTGERLRHATAFQQSGRLCMLHGLICQGEWRVPTLWHRFIEQVALPLACDVHSYHNVRSRLGGMLGTLAQYDVPFMYTEPSLPAKYHQVKTADIVERFNALLPRIREIVSSGAAPADEPNNSRVPSTADLQAMEVDPQSPPSDVANDELKQERQILKTLLDFTCSHYYVRDGPVSRPVLELLPLLLYFENVTTDEELRKSAETQLVYYASRVWLNEEQVSIIFEICNRLIANESQWWKVLVSVCTYLQLITFSNLYIFRRENYAQELRRLLHILLVHERIEVRQAAKFVLLGLYTCRLWSPEDKEIIRTYTEWTQSKELSRRHAGVLALCALVQCAPYTVPPTVPDIIVRLSRHTHLPADHICQTAVRACMSEFKRTHQDCWHEHKQKFTEEQLEVVRDLLISPSYYV